MEIFSKENIREILSIFLTSYFGGVLVLLFGAFTLYQRITRKKHYVSEFSFYYYAEYLGAVGMIGLGISILVLKLLGKV